MGKTSFNNILSLPYQAPDQVISYGDKAFQYAEHWRPATTKSVPLIILIHGGCWLNEYAADHVRPLASKLAERGYAVWSVEYRRVGDIGGGWPGSFEDILDSINKVRDLENIDLNNIFLLGHSAGGHLALWAASRFPENSIFSHKLQLKIKGVIELAAISNLVEYAQGNNSCERVTSRLLGGSPKTHFNRYELTSPHLLPLGTNATLIHGEADSIVNISQSVQLSGTNNNISLISEPELGHFDLINPNERVFEHIVHALKKLSEND